MTTYSVDLKNSVKATHTKPESKCSVWDCMTPDSKTEFGMLLALLAVLAAILLTDIWYRERLKKYSPAITVIGVVTVVYLGYYALRILAATCLYFFRKKTDKKCHHLSKHCKISPGIACAGVLYVLLMTAFNIYFILHNHQRQVSGWWPLFTILSSVYVFVMFSALYF
jgi:uncharacterized membrane protein